MWKSLCVIHNNFNDNLTYEQGHGNDKSVTPKIVKLINMAYIRFKN